jgi:hypothetical protein
MIFQGTGASFEFVVQPATPDLQMALDGDLEHSIACYDRIIAHGGEKSV